MKISAEVDYRKFRFNKLNTDEFRHLKLLLFWPICGAVFLLLERYTVNNYHPIHCALDDLIPFNEYFLIPYGIWFLFLIFPIVYTLFFDVKTFRKIMMYVMFTYSVSMIVYFIYPNGQDLRPTEFARDNFLVDIIKNFVYVVDTNTNITPSIHVIGSFSFVFASFHAKGLSKPWIKAIFIMVAISVCLSTVFIKQHSIIDVFAAIPVSFAGYFFGYHIDWEKIRNKRQALRRLKNE